MITYDDIRKSEKKKASKMLGGSRDPRKVKHALKHFYLSLDKNMSNVVQATNIPLECKEGCYYCCYLKVDTKAHEIFLIADYVNSNKDEIEALKIRLNSNANIISPLTRDEHWVINIKCALLINDRCSVYPVRPALCRKFHSYSADLCKQSYERPTDSSIPSSEDENLNISAREAIVGFGEAIKRIKLDSETYDVHRALLLALNEPEREAEWRKGNKAFPETAESKK